MKKLTDDDIKFIKKAIKNKGYGEEFIQRTATGGFKAYQMISCNNLSNNLRKQQKALKTLSEDNYISVEESTIEQLDRIVDWLYEKAYYQKDVYIGFDDNDSMIEFHFASQEMKI